MARRKRQVVFFFREGDPTALQVFGGKGAGLVKLSREMFPVPPGFIISTTVSRALLQEEQLPKRLQWQLNRGVADLERETGKKFGGAPPLLVSVRSGAPVSMPGMMETILNVGVNPQTLENLIAETGDPEFGHDTYRRFLLGFGVAVLGYERSELEKVVEDARSSQEVWERLRAMFGSELPDGPREQLKQAVAAVCRSWNSPRARDYRALYNLSSQLGTAVVVQAMVFGNRGVNSGSGVVFSRNVATGEPELYGEFLPNAQGEELVSGTKTPEPISFLCGKNPEITSELKGLVRELERLERDAVDVEFTVEDGRLCILQCRRAKRATRAAVRICVDMVREGLIGEKEAISRFSKEELEKLARPIKRLKSAAGEGVRGLAASPGAAVGKACFSAERAQELARRGEQVVLVRLDTDPDDFAGMLASCAIVTSRGGTTCHAAVVARALGVPAVVGTGAQVDERGFHIGNRVVAEGEYLSVDGSSGTVFLGELELVEEEPCIEAKTLLEWVEKRRRPVNFEIIHDHWCVNTILNNVYILEMLRHEAQDELVREIGSCYDSTLNQAAQLFATYLLAAVAGELRHGWQYANQTDQEKLVSWGIYETTDRTEAQVTGVKRLLEVGGNDVLVEFCEVAERTFLQFPDASFGGRPWADIAQTLRLYLAGEINQTVFVDRVFDLRHNGGVLFNKHPMVSLRTDETVLHRQLDVKRENVPSHDRIHQLRALHEKVLPEVERLMLRVYPNLGRRS